VFDHLDRRAADRPGVRATADAIRDMGAEFRSTMDDQAEWLAAYGWRARVFRVPALAERYGRALPGDGDAAAANVMILTAATR
jgi:hypothetical protein